MTYRQMPRAELVLAGEAAPSAYMWVIWLAATTVVAVVLTVTDVAGSGLLIAGAFVATLIVLLALHEVARQFRWRIVLEGSVLRIDQLGIRGVRRIATLDVAQGLKLAFDLSPNPASLELRLVLITESARAVWGPGQRVAPVVDALVDFLRSHNVDVSPPAPLPVNWSPPSAPFVGG